MTTTTITQALQAANALLDQRMRELRAELDATQALLTMARGQAQDDRQTMDDLLGQIQELLEERDQAREEAEGLSAELEQAHEDYDAAQARIQDLEERLRWPRP